MAEMILRLQIDPETGKKNILVKLISDEDALPHEHENMHRELVEKLLEGGVLKPGEAGDLIIEREDNAPLDNAPISTPEDQRQAQGEGQ